MRNLDNAIKKIAEHRGPLTEALIIRTAKSTLNQYDMGWIKPNNQELIEAIEAIGVREFLENPLHNRRLDRDLTNKGIQWLRRYVFKKNGQIRNTKDVRMAIGDREAQIIHNFSHFTFEGFYCCGRRGNFVPMWRVHSKNQLDSFVYIFTGGRYGLGGGLEVVG